MSTGSGRRCARTSAFVTLSVEREGGVNLAYLDTAGEGRRLVLLQHFRGHLDNWDPALIDERRVITFDSEGVGGSEGSVAHTVADTAAAALRSSPSRRAPSAEDRGPRTGRHDAT